MAALNQETRDILDKIIADAVSLLPEETRQGVREAFSVSMRQRREILFPYSGI